jgi:hypothetical protein
MFHFETTNEFNRLKAEFIKTDLDVALTLAEIARQTPDSEKAARNQRNARKAYDAVLWYIGRAILTNFEQEYFIRKLASLKSSLVILGESF